MAYVPPHGRVTLHRLNRVEYNNTVRDLLGSALRPAADFARGGFDLHDLIQGVVAADTFRKRRGEPDPVGGGSP